MRAEASLIARESACNGSSVRVHLCVDRVPLRMRGGRHRPLRLKRTTFGRPEPLGRHSLDLDATLVFLQPMFKRQKLGVEGSCHVEVAGSRKLVFEVVVELEHVPEVFGAWEA